MYQPVRDLAGEICFRPNFWQTKSRIDYLIEKYLRDEKLCDCLEDLQRQFQAPQLRKWAAINWQDIHPEQVIGLELSTFLFIIEGALNIEVSFAQNNQTTKQYLEPIHPTMAKFVDGASHNLSLEKKEEFQKKSGSSRSRCRVGTNQCSLALGKIYQQLTNQNISLIIESTTDYQPRINPYQDLYRHGLDRVVNEYSIMSLYIWLMSNTTGTLQQILGELLQDKVNQLSKFWGMGMWLYPDGVQQLIHCLLSQINTILPVSCNPSSQTEPNSKSTWQHLMSALAWQSWSTVPRPKHKGFSRMSGLALTSSISAKGELIYTLIWILKRMWHWSGQLNPEYLHYCCATPEFFGNNNVEFNEVRGNPVVSRRGLSDQPTIIVL
ncbi:MAG: ferritin-like domain-containing protein [Cyanobacteria bacterium P01_G01_bin.39]